MHESRCTFASLAAVRTHSDNCPECRANPRRIFEVAIEILLSETSADHQQQTGVRVLLLDPGQLRPPRPKESPTLTDFVNRCFEPEVLRFMNPGGRRSYTYTIQNYVLPEIGALRLSEITFEIFQRLIGKFLDAGYAVQTAKHIRQITNRVFSPCHERIGEFSGRLPTSGIKFPAMVRREKHALTIEQARSVLQGLRSPYREMALVSMTTSMNVAELCALRWKRVNFHARSPFFLEGEIIPPYSLAVRESYYEGSFGPPKTRNRKRCIPLALPVLTALQRIKDTSRFPGPNDIVFVSRNGTPKTGSNVRHQIIKPLGQKLDIPWLNWHTFRNTFATIGEQLGMSLSNRQAQMGHGSMWMTQEYTVSDVEDRRAASELMAEKLC